MTFFLGTHCPEWLSRTSVPLFISRRRLSISPRTKAKGAWALDSGGFSELTLFGSWQTTPQDYADEVRRWSERIGGLQWAAIQDWMCEPFMLTKTGLTIHEHQSRTIESFWKLRELAPEIHWVPVLQGWRPDDYLRHNEDYRRSGVDLASLPLVGVGSVCRRQKTREALDILRSLRARGLSLHGFGFKIDGLHNGASKLLASSDSLAWSRGARFVAPLPGCTHKTCANCFKYAMLWRERVLDATSGGKESYQQSLFEEC